MNGNHKISDTNGAIPSIVFTIPPMAAVGILEETAKKHGLRFRPNYEEDTSSWYSSRRVGEKFSAFKVLIEEGSDRILGAYSWSICGRANQYFRLSYSAWNYFRRS